MIYFKPSIFEDFKVTLTIEDSLTENRKRIYNDVEIQKIYSNIINEKYHPDYQVESKKILENLNHKNERKVFNTSKGEVFIEGDKFYNKYSEIQIHAKRVPIKYISEIRLTDNYFDIKESDKIYREKLLKML
jgi:GH15 family glucan-1,4-alpha-glucosidase